MFTVQLFQFNKKTNSTKQPTDVSWLEIVCKIRDASSIHNPTITIQFDSSVKPIEYNYARLPDLNRYYFIDDWFFENGLWTAALVEDVLATFKTEIGNYNGYILRAASDFNGRVSDNTYPIISRLTQTVENQTASPFNKNIGEGMYVVGIMNGSTNSIGAVSYYIFDQQNFRNFCNYLFNSTDYMGTINDVSEGLLKSLVNPFQYVASCVWLPFPVCGATSQTIKLGWWDITATCVAMVSTINRQTGYFDIAVPKHPKAVTRGYYLLTSPYSNYFLDIPPFGNVDIDPQFLIDCDNIRCVYSVDMITGAARIALCDAATADSLNSQCYFTVLNGQVGAQIQLAASAPNIINNGTVSTGIDTATNWATSGLDNIAANNDNFIGRAASWLSEKLGGVSQTVKNAAGTASNVAVSKIGGQTSVQTVGTNGGISGGQQYIKLIGRFADIADEDITNRGRPLCEMRTISTLSGFMQVGNANVQLTNATSEEYISVSNWLQGGFYYE